MSDIIEKINSSEILESYIARVTGFVWKNEGSGKNLESCPVCSGHDCFKLSPKGFVKCFQCQIVAFNILQFRSVYENISYKEAIEKFVDELGIKKYSKRDIDWIGIREMACEISRDILFTTPTKYLFRGKNITPLQYLTDYRKHSYEAIHYFRLGFNDGSLIEKLKEKYSDEIIKSSGLMAIQTGVFMYPFIVGGEIKYFRLKDPNKIKKAQMPAIVRAKDAIWYNQDCIKDGVDIFIVEGEDDVISLWEADENVVGSYGNVTKEQTDYLKRFDITTIYSCFDKDPEGERDTERLVKNYDNTNIFIINIPEGKKDIDEILRDVEDKSAVVQQLKIGASIPSPELKSLIRQKSEGYFITKYGFKGSVTEIKLTNWIGIVEAVIIREDGLRDRKIKIKQGKHETTVFMDGTVLSNASRFREFLLNNLNTTCLFQGGDTDLNALVQYWGAAYSPIIVKETECVGEIAEGFIADNIFIGLNNEIKPLVNGYLQIDEKHSIKIAEISNQAGARAEIPYYPLNDPLGGIDKFKEKVFDMMIKNRNMKIAIAIGWLKATLWSKTFFEQYKWFPLLMIHGKMASGKCLAKGSKILLGDGSYCNVEDFKGGEVQTCYIDKVAPIKCQSSFTNGVKDCYEIELQTGKRLIATPNHPFLCLELRNKNRFSRHEAYRGKIRWVLLQELYDNREKFLVLTPKKINVEGILKENISEVIIIAYLLGDGNLHHKCFTNSNIVLSDDFIFHAKNLNYDVRKQPDKTTFTYFLQYKKEDRVNNRYAKTKFNSFLDRWGIDRNWKAGDKQIPKKIFQMDNKSVAIFLNRIFSCDGWVQNISNYQRVNVGYCSKSYELIFGISNLLLRFGIWGIIRKKIVKGVDYYWLAINHAESIMIFFKEIGMLKVSEKDTIEILKNLEQRAKIQCSKLPISFLDFYNLETVKSVKEVGKHETWDLTVDMTHNFIANGMVVHNTIFSNWLMSMIGMRNVSPISLRTGGTTSVGLERRLAYYSSLPVWTDDYRNSEEEGQRFHTFFRNIFDRVSASKGIKNEERKIRQVIVRGCLLVDGESSPTDAALNSRMITFELTSAERVEKYYYELVKLEPDFGFIGFDWVKHMNTQYSVFHNKFIELEQLLRKEIAFPRQAQIWAVALAGALTEPYFKEQEEKLINYATRLANHEIEEQKSEEIIGMLWEATDILYRAKKLSKAAVYQDFYDSQIQISLPMLLGLINGESITRRYKLPNSREVSKLLRQEKYVLGAQSCRIPDESSSWRWIVDIKHPDLPETLKNLFSEKSDVDSNMDSL